MQDQDTSNWQRWAIIALIVIAVAITAYVVVSAIITRLNTGVLQVQAADNVSLRIGKTGEETKVIGSGTVEVRLEPGTYQLTAAAGKGKTTRPVTIIEQQTTKVRMHVTKPVPTQRVMAQAAKDVFVHNGRLYFIHPTELVLYTAPIGANAARPYRADISPLGSVYWLSPNSFFARLTGGARRYVTAGGKQPLVPALSIDANKMSFSRDGGFAFAVSAHTKTIMRAGGPTDAPQPIGTFKSLTTRVGLAPNGSVLAYTPGSISDAKSLVKTRLYRDGTWHAMPKRLRGIETAQWSPDSTRFSYTTESGMFIYNLQSGHSTRVIATKPSNPQSPTWVDADTLLYIHRGTIWRYELGQEASHKLAKLHGGLITPEPFQITKNGIVYFGTTGQNGAIYRLSLDGSELPQLPETSNAETAYRGFQVLLDHGVSTDQVELLKYAFSLYGQQEGLPLRTVAIKSIRAEPLNKRDNNPFIVIHMNVRINGQRTYQARFGYFSITTIKLKLSQNGQVVFRSGKLDAGY